MASSYSSHLWGLRPWGSRTHHQEPADLSWSLRCRPLDKSQLKHGSSSRWLLAIVHKYGLLAYPGFNKKLEVFTPKFGFLVSLNKLEDLATLNCILVGLDEQSWEAASLFWWPLLFTSPVTTSTLYWLSPWLEGIQLANPVLAFHSPHSWR